MMTVQEIQNGLSQCYGSDILTRHWTGKIVATEGVMWLAQSADAFWLFDLVASYQGNAKALEQCDGFQIWKLTVDLEKKTAVATCHADKGTPPLVRQEIEFTDFPLPEIKLYLSDNILMLPSEY